MKKSIAWMVCLALCLVLAGCGGGGSSVSQSEASSSVPSSSQQEESSSIASSTEQDSSVSDSGRTAGHSSGGELSDDLADFQVQLDGDVFSVPCTFQDFFDKGWEAEKDLATMELGDREGTTTRMLKGDSYFSVSFANTSGGNQMAVDSTVYKISVVSTAKSGQKVDMMMPGGITYGATVEDLKAAYGEPDNEHDSGEFINVTYNQIGGYHSIQFTVYHEGGLMQLELNRLEIK